MDKLDQFIKNKTGVGIDTDGYYGFQCMDLMHEYCRTVLGLNDLRILAQGNAKSVYLNFDNVFGHELFEKLPKDAEFKKGDIMFYDWGEHGHVDIFVQGDRNNFRAFSQNWITPNSQNGLPAIVNHPDYNGVLGGLRYKGQSPALSTDGNLQKELDKVRAERDRNWNLYMEADKKLKDHKCPPAENPLHQEVLTNIQREINRL